MSPAERLNFSQAALAAVCARYRVRELAVFGSAARGDARPDSDVDLLVLFEDGTRVSLFTLIDLQAELSRLFDRPVDLVPKDGLKPVLRQEVLAEAQVLYAA
jgi:predicted nucleotidyltransferase